MHETSPRTRASRSIVLLLGGALAAGLSLAGCSRQSTTDMAADDNAAPLPLERDDSGQEIAPPAPEQAAIIDQVSEDQDLANNSYVAGMGYYHSVSHTWYPYPFNWYYPSYGYYYFGSWHPRAYVSFFPSYSRPSRRSIVIYQHYHTVYVPSSSHSTTIIHSTSGSSYFPSNATVRRSTTTAAPTSVTHTSTNTSSSGSHSGSMSGVARGGFGSSAHASSGS